MKREVKVRAVYVNPHMEIDPAELIEAYTGLDFDKAVELIFKRAKEIEKTK